MKSKSTILFFASNPEDVPLLSLDEEARAITDKIEKSEHRDALNLVTRWATRPDDLLQELNRQRPIVVHFSGHGSSSGELVLMNETRQAKPVSPAALRALFSTLKDNIRLVVLNACYSKTQATGIADVIDCVIGMNASIGDRAAVAFAASLYRALGFGRSVKEAFEQAKVSLMLEGIPEENTPELLTRTGVDPGAVHLIVTTTAEETHAHALDLTITRDQDAFHLWVTNRGTHLIRDVEINAIPDAEDWMETTHGRLPTLQHSEVGGVELVHPILGGWFHARVTQLSPNRGLMVASFRIEGGDYTKMDFDASWNDHAGMQRKSHAVANVRASVGGVRLTPRP